MFIEFLVICIVVVNVGYLAIWSKKRKLHSLKLILEYMNMCGYFIRTHSNYEEYFKFIQMDRVEYDKFEEIQLFDLSKYKYRVGWVKQIGEFKFYALRYGQLKTRTMSRCVCFVNNIKIADYHRDSLNKEIYELNHNMPKQMIKNLKSTTSVIRQMKKNFKKNTKHMLTDEEAKIRDEKNKLIEYYNKRRH